MKSIKAWVLKPYKSLGPIPLVKYCKDELIKELGEPVHSDIPQFGEDTLTFATAEGDLKAMFFKNEKLICLILPKLILKVSEKNKTLELPGQSDEVKKWLAAADPEVSTYNMPWGRHFASRRLSVGCYLKDESIRIFSKEARAWLYNAGEVNEDIDPLPSDKKVIKIAKQIKEANMVTTKSCYQPIFPKKNDKTPPVSLLGGAMVLAAGEAWPLCPCCQGPLTPMVQVSIEALPIQAKNIFKGHGLFQLAFCLKKECKDLLCFVDEKGQGPFMCRILGPHGMSEYRELSEEIKNIIMSPVLITGWEAEDDFPNIEGLRENCNDKKFAIIHTDEFDEVYSDLFPILKFKLGGFPSWMYEEEVPHCRICGPEKNHMQFVLQFNLFVEPLIFSGKGGVFHVFQCSKHQEILVPYIQF
jgi:hypothetical protein